MMDGGGNRNGTKFAVIREGGRGVCIYNNGNCDGHRLYKYKY